MPVLRRHFNIMYTYRTHHDFNKYENRDNIIIIAATIKSFALIIIPNERN